jgi:hypothetical protein
MIDGSDPSRDGHPSPSVAKLHNLAVNLASMQRLLGRRDGDGVLVRADTALIRTAIGAGYDEVRRVRALLATIPDDPMATWHPTVEALHTALRKLDIMLNALAAAVALRDG